VCLLRGTYWVFKCNSTFCPHTVFMCFVWISEQIAIISLYNINWLVFIIETECVYCAVRIESLNLLCLRLICDSHVQVVSPAVCQSSVLGHCEIYGGRSGCRTGFPPTFPPVSTIPTMLHIHLHLHVTLTGRTNGRSLGLF